eukprot:TRINITY_DN26110_c0_g1_i1.p3 TRINITY_DN26110_c0_g1~~TRINITY_DN26110_c0_g1_i1.p3  ORF type:complete len:150 (-),score=48.77 TRINITY_DN26110_c0_g1_i1:314-763(-)
MPGKDGGSASSSTQKVEQHLDAAMSTMKDNMNAMIQRDAQLDHLQSRTNDLQGASNAFGKEAKRLREHQNWQRYRIYIVVAMLLSWVVVGIFFQKHMVQWVLCSLLITGSIFMMRAFLVSRADAASAKRMADVERSLHSGGEGGEAPLE